MLELSSLDTSLSKSLSLHIIVLYNSDIGPALQFMFFLYILLYPIFYGVQSKKYCKYGEERCYMMQEIIYVMRVMCISISVYVCLCKYYTCWTSLAFNLAKHLSFE